MDREPLIGMAQDGLAASAGVRRRACRHPALRSTTSSATMKAKSNERNWLRDGTGGSVYLRLSTRPLEQTSRTMTPALRSGHRRWRLVAARAGPNCQVVVAYTGAVAPEAIQAAA